MHTTVVTAYLISGIACIVLFLLALVFSNGVNYEPDKSDVRKRKIIFWVFNIVSLLGGLALNYFLELKGIRVPSKAESYLIHMAIAAVVFFVLYIVIGFVLSKVCKGKKVETWF
ncbi:MAG: hypothetical protein MJZ14_02005 [Paludibacteraceae bacterium]|nr:hypothetical protein [Paludibacteraceae bacterium]